MSYYTDTFTFSSVFTGDWWNDQPPTQGELLVSTQASMENDSPLNLGLALEGLGGTALVGYDTCIGPKISKGLAKKAWAFRRLEARRFEIPLMQVSWRRCLYLAAISSYLKQGWNLHLYRALHQDPKQLTWC